jgi:UDP-N-acetyl-D-mannosaminuronate dehydrogenase
MKKATLYTLDVSMIQELNRKMPRGQRSAFVNKAIRARLNNESEFNIEDVTTKQLILELTYRGDIPKSARSYLMELYREVRE